MNTCVSQISQGGASAVSRRAALLAAAGLVSAPAWAQFRVDVSGVGLTQMPIAVAPFRGEEAALQKISAIVLADLARTQQFRSIDAVSASLDETARPDMSMWRQRAADALVAGSVLRNASDRYEVRFRLWDVVRGQDLGGEVYNVAAADLRRAAHRVADYVYEKLTGDKGVFSTRLAYVTKAAGRYHLWVADADGENAQSALSSAEPVISPAWSPDGSQLAYVSFEARKPVVYAHNVASGQRRVIANFRGSNSAPAWSPDGSQLALTLSRDGSSQIYSISPFGGTPQRLTQMQGIDTEAAYSGDGKSIYFVSDRGGAPQIYRMPVSGGAAERITFAGSYNISPAPSPDGRWLAYISRVNGAFRLHLMELASGAVTALTTTSADESPSFAPNSKLIVYATLDSRQEALMTTTLDGKTKTRLTGRGGDIREPAWGPFQR